MRKMGLFLKDTSRRCLSLFIFYELLMFLILEVEKKFCLALPFVPALRLLRVTWKAEVGIPAILVNEKLFGNLAVRSLVTNVTASL